MDETTTIADLKRAIATFVAERDWEQYHTPKNLSMDLACEAAELMEKFIWSDSQSSVDLLQSNRKEIENELSDILIALLAFANACSIDISSAFDSKLQEVKKKYPAQLVRGKSHKYTYYKRNK